MLINHISTKQKDPVLKYKIRAGKQPESCTDRTALFETGPQVHLRVLATAMFCEICNAIILKGAAAWKSNALN